ncbi:hypothetical protein GCM10010201_00410 [Pilimelia columellifera subsp. columellifera]|uniref:Uncharacterized protein n=1 Tax=Pilimelia columellifera subsp. columellifera TaxID=706583 RepID=A0ABP6A331_9ACTN
MWVNREIEHWTTTKSADRILPVVTDGHWEWDETRGDFTDDSTAVPAALRGVFTEEPLFLDLRWTRKEQHLSLRHPRFRDAIAQLAAPMHGVSKDELAGEDVRQHRRMRRLRSVGVTALLVLGFVASLAGLLAARNGERATAAMQETRRQEELASEQRANTERFAQEAQRQQSNANQQESRASDAAAQTQREQRLALQQRELAKRASAEAARQEANARRQEQFAAWSAARARDQQQLADKAAREAARQQKIAEEQQQLAKKAAVEAGRQKANADRQQRLAIGRRLTSEAKAIIGSDPRTALMIGLAARDIQAGDIQAGAELVSLMTSTHYIGTVDDALMAGTAANNIMVTCNQNGSVSLSTLKHLQMPTPLTTFDGGCGYSTPDSLDISPDGRTLAVIREGGVLLWDTSNPLLPIRLAPLARSSGDDQIAHTTFSPDGRFVATVSWRGRVMFWDLTDRAQPRQLPPLPAGPSGAETIVFSPDGRTIASIGRSEDVTLWDVREPSRPIRLYQLSEKSSQASFNANGSALATANGRGAVTLWDVTNRALPKRQADLTGSLSGWIAAIAFSPDGNLLAAGDDDGTVALWDLVNSADPVILSMGRKVGIIQRANFSSDGRTLITGGYREPLTLWNVSDFRGVPATRAELAHGGKPLIAAAYHQSGRSLTTADQDGGVTFWDIANPVRRDRRRIFPTDKPVTEAIAFSKDGGRMAIPGKMGVIFWDLTDQARPYRVATLSALRTPNYLAFNANGQTVAASYGLWTELWNISNISVPIRVARFKHNDWVRSMAFSPDGRTVAVATSDRTVVMWDLTNPTSPTPVASLTGYSDWVGALAFNQDGQTLATGTVGRAMVIWDVTDRGKPTQLVALKRSDLQTYYMAFGADRNVLVAGGFYGPSDSGSITLWDYAELNKLRADPAMHACTSVGRGLTAAEWRRFVPEFPYRPTCGG